MLLVQLDYIFSNIPYSYCTGSPETLYDLITHILVTFYHSEFLKNEIGNF